MCNFNHFKSRCNDCLFDNFLFHIENAGCDINSARLHLVYDYRRQRNENICKNIGGNDIVFFVSDSVLYFFVINDISDHHIKSFYRNSINFFVFLNRRNRTRIEVCSDRMTRTKLQCNNRKNTASGSDIKQLGILCHIFL